MRTVLCTLVLAMMLGAATTAAEAQLRSESPEERAPVQVFDEDSSPFTLNQLFSPEHFRMSHSYSMSVSSFSGEAASLGQYTNTMQWQFNDQLAARLDVAFMHRPFQGQPLGDGSGNIGSQVYLRNAEVAYRPTENTRIRLSFQQRPYAGYMSPYGYASPYGYHRYDRYGGFGAGFDDHRSRPLFWKDSGGR